MDKALVYGTRDSGFDPQRSRSFFFHFCLPNSEFSLNDLAAFISGFFSSKLLSSKLRIFTERPCCIRIRSFLPNSEISLNGLAAFISFNARLCSYCPQRSRSYFFLSKFRTFTERPCNMPAFIAFTERPCRLLNLPLVVQNSTVIPNAQSSLRPIG